MINAILTGSRKVVRGMLFSVNEFNDGNASCTMIMPKPNDITESIMDSDMNCLMSCVRCAPIDFRTPTSFIRFIARDVDRLMKFSIAMTSIKIAVADKM